MEVDGHRIPDDVSGFQDDHQFLVCFHPAPGCGVYPLQVGLGGSELEDIADEPAALIGQDCLVFSRHCQINAQNVHLDLLLSVLGFSVVGQRCDSAPRARDGMLTQTCP